MYSKIKGINKGKSVDEPDTLISLIILYWKTTSSASSEIVSKLRKTKIQAFATKMSVVDMKKTMSEKFKMRWNRGDFESSDSSVSMMVEYWKEKNIDPTI